MGEGEGERAMAAAAAAAAEAADGPVLSVVSKRLRALRKKYNRIMQMEESLAQGKTLNKEQEDVLRSKPVVAALIDELDKLRLPLSSALSEELPQHSPSPPPAEAQQQPSPPVAPGPDAVEDLLTLLYFGYLFDVKPQSEFSATMLTRTHERGCCLTYDYVTDDSTDLLGERDLDAISELGALLTARPASSGASHRDSLQDCIQHARFWLQNSDLPIHSGASAVTYAGLREKLSKILASDYFTTVPEIKAPVDVAAAVGKYGSAHQVLISDGAAADVSAPAVQAEEVLDHYHDKDSEEDFHGTEIPLDLQSLQIDETQKLDEVDAQHLSSDHVTTQKEQPHSSAQKDQQKLDASIEEQDQRFGEPKDQQYIPRRSYQNQRGGRGGGRRGFPNGRGGRGGRGGGGYQNGRSQYHDSGYPRNYYNARGRGGRPGNSAVYGNHGGAHGGHVPVRVELDANS